MESLKRQTLIVVVYMIVVCESSTEFIFNANFTSPKLHLYANSTIQPSFLSLTNDTTLFSIGRALYDTKIPTNDTKILTFSTSFIFSLPPIHGFQPGHGFAFVLLPSLTLAGATAAQNLGLFNRTTNGRSANHVAAVEFDVFRNEEFHDINDNHVGLNLNSLTSVAAADAGFWSGRNFKPLDLNNGANYQVWIDYRNSTINVSMAVSGEARPLRPLLSESVDLSRILSNESYVGFAAATGQLKQRHLILAWSFSETNSSIGDALITQGLPSFLPRRVSFFETRGFVIGVSLGCVAVVALVLVILLVRQSRNRRRGFEAVEDWETEFWPHRIPYKEIDKATEGFSERNVIGMGGNGKVYRGVMNGGLEEIAVKRIALNNGQGTREFVAEISSLGRLKHRNLVGLKGWCKREKGNLILVYEYMQNGSLDKRIFESEKLLSWEERVRVLSDVARGVLYLHEGWEVKVLHRDIKASNVLLDKEMNARLGDFGLAKMHSHGQGQLANSTRVVGTVGYLAPEVVQTGRVSVETDVYGFGVLVLEVVSGRRPVVDGKPGLVEWVGRLMEANELGSVVDQRLVTRNDMKEVERLVCLGLACVSHDPNARPNMGQVLRFLEGKFGEVDEHGLGLNLLDKIVATAAASVAATSAKRPRRAHHYYPTFEEVRSEVSSFGEVSMTLTDSNVIRTGR